MANEDSNKLLVSMSSAVKMLENISMSDVEILDPLDCGFDLLVVARDLLDASELLVRYLAQRLTAAAIRLSLRHPSASEHLRQKCFVMVQLALTRREMKESTSPDHSFCYRLELARLVVKEIGDRFSEPSSINTIFPRYDQLSRLVATLAICSSNLMGTRQTTVKYACQLSDLLNGWSRLYCRIGKLSNSQFSGEAIASEDSTDVTELRGTIRSLLLKYLHEIPSQNFPFDLLSLHPYSLRCFAKILLRLLQEQEFRLVLDWSIFRAFLVAAQHQINVAESSPPRSIAALRRKVVLVLLQLLTGTLEPDQSNEVCTALCAQVLGSSDNQDSVSVWSVHLVDLFLDQDNELIDMLLLTFATSARTPVWYEPGFRRTPGTNTLVCLVDPVVCWFHFLRSVAFDHLVLVDLLISSETEFLRCFLTFLKTVLRRPASLQAAALELESHPDALGSAMIDLASTAGNSPSAMIDLASTAGNSPRHRKDSISMHPAAVSNVRMSYSQSTSDQNPTVLDFSQVHSSPNQLNARLRVSRFQSSSNQHSSRVMCSQAQTSSSQHSSRRRSSQAQTSSSQHSSSLRFSRAQTSSSQHSSSLRFIRARTSSSQHSSRLRFRRAQTSSSLKINNTNLIPHFKGWLSHRTAVSDDNEENRGTLQRLARKWTDYDRNSTVNISQGLCFAPSEGAGLLVLLRQTLVNLKLALEKFHLRALLPYNPSCLLARIHSVVELIG